MRHDRKQTMIDRIRADLNRAKGLHLDKNVIVGMYSGRTTLTGAAGSDYYSIRDITIGRYDLTKAFRGLDGSIKIIAFEGAPSSYGALRCLQRYGFSDITPGDFKSTEITSSTFVTCEASASSLRLQGSFAPRFTMLTTYTLQDVINYYGFKRFSMKMFETLGMDSDETWFTNWAGTAYYDPSAWGTFIGALGMVCQADTSMFGAAAGWTFDEIVEWSSTGESLTDITWERHSGNGVNRVILTTNPEGRPAQIGDTITLEWESQMMSIEEAFGDSYKPALWGGQASTTNGDYYSYGLLMGAIGDSNEISSDDISWAFNTVPWTFRENDIEDRLSAPAVKDLTDTVKVPYMVNVSGIPGTFELGYGKFSRDGRNFHCFYLVGDGDAVTGEYVLGFEVPTGTEMVYDIGAKLVNGRLPDMNIVGSIGNLPVRQFMVLADVVRSNYYNTSAATAFTSTADGDGFLIRRGTDGVGQVYPGLAIRGTEKV